MSIQNYFEILPSGVAFHIFSFLKIQELSRCCRVSKKWQQLSRSNTLWKIFFPNVILKEGELLKSHLDKIMSASITSKTGMDKYLTKFILEMELYTIYKIEFISHFNTNFYIKMKLKCTPFKNELNKDSNPYNPSDEETAKVKKTNLFYHPSIPQLTNCETDFSGFKYGVLSLSYDVKASYDMEKTTNLLSKRTLDKILFSSFNLKTENYNESSRSKELDRMAKMTML